MYICEKISDIRKLVSRWKSEGESIGLVPTMGFLHEGHGSLVRRSVSENGKTVVSVFVNPSQFGPNEDFEAYPRDFEKDKSFLENLKADAVFHPSYNEMYASENSTYVYVGGMSEKLCGISRPIHFKGVATVVSKLFNIVTPDNAYFGLKDFQQYVIISRMARDLNFNVKITGVPIIRDEDGLALSSRNVYLTPEERISALSLNRSLKLAKEMVNNNKINSSDIIASIVSIIREESNARIDYVKIVDSGTLEDTDIVIPGHTSVLLAVYIGKTRLIDNMQV